jgi:ferredoxin
VEASSAALPPDALRVERFAPRQAADAGDRDRPLEVVCERSAITVQVGLAETILEAVRAAGVDVESSCEEGICGTCEARVLEGRPDHRDSLLSEVERRAGTTMMICCSRALDDRLVLDL